MKFLNKAELKQCKSPVDCEIISNKIESVSDFITTLSFTSTAPSKYWFRGQGSVTWGLTPSALRSKFSRNRTKALSLIHGFRKIAETKINRHVDPTQSLMWMQLAQHYGVPTRLLDWTENSLFALFFACAHTLSDEEASIGMVFVMNPEHIGHISQDGLDNSLETDIRGTIVKEYINLGPDSDRAGLSTIAIRPVWNSERLLQQRGMFTLHGSRHFGLDRKQAPSLVGLPILPNYKSSIKASLESLGIDEMALFPELEYASIYLKRRAGLMK